VPAQTELKSRVHLPVGDNQSGIGAVRLIRLILVPNCRRLLKSFVSAIWRRKFCILRLRFRRWRFFFTLGLVIFLLLFLYSLLVSLYAGILINQLNKWFLQ
jgi:hypothetical protein